MPPQNKHGTRQAPRRSADVQALNEASIAAENARLLQAERTNLIAYVALPDKMVAETFERYLKTGSGRAFAKRHLLS
jgi:hypothetical protein